MGAPKLLLPLSGQPLIESALAAWARSRVDRIIVVVRPGDEALAAAVQQAGGSKIQNPKSKIDTLIPDAPPPDMKASVQAALRHIEKRHAPIDTDAFLVAPADMPRLSTSIIDRVVQRHAAGAAETVIVPSIRGKRGHPVLMSWSLAGKVFGLQPDEGLNAIVERHGVELVPCEDLVATGEYPFADVDTKEEYEGITGRASD